MQEGDPEGWWEETFKSHTDSKPRGPEAMSLDLAFPGAQHVYGLPERATALSLEATTGVSSAALLCCKRSQCSCMACEMQCTLTWSAPGQRSMGPATRAWVCVRDEGN